MKKQEGLQDKLANFFGTIERSSRKISEAIKENTEELFNLNCVKDEILDFNLVESDLEEIHKTLEIEEKNVLGSHLILVENEDKMELQIYTQKDGKVNRTTITHQVKRVINAPDYILDELKKKGRVEINLKI